MLTPEQERAIVEWRRLYRPVCRVCGGADVVIEGVSAMPIIENGVVTFTKQIPVVPIVCRHCGDTLLVSATALKFFQPLNDPRKV